MKLHRFFIIFLSLLLITCDMRADGGDVLERIIRLPGTKGTVYSLLSKVSEQSGYLFVYDSKVVNNDIEQNGQPPLQEYIKPCAEHRIV